MAKDCIVQDRLNVSDFDAATKTLEQGGCDAPTTACAVLLSLKRASFTPARYSSASNERRLPLRGTPQPQTSVVYLCAVLLSLKRVSFTPARYFSASNEHRLPLRGTPQPQTSVVYLCAEPHRVKKALFGRFTQGKKQRDGHLVMPNLGQWLFIVQR